MSADLTVPPLTVVEELRQWRHYLVASCIPARMPPRPVRVVLDDAAAAIASLQARLEAAERDAARWRMLPAFLEEFQINYVRLILAIDDALDDSADAATQEKPAAPSEGSQG